MNDNAAALGRILKEQSLCLATAESCTGGLLSAVITSVSGSSDWFERGFVTYSNAAKMEMLGVDEAVIAEQGAVSEATAVAMVEGALKYSHADLACSITGIAGPLGGTQHKSVGTVCFAIAGKKISTVVVTEHFSGDRESIREQSVNVTLEKLLEILKAS